ncbi:glutamate receptor ionotropic, delta-2-like [Palaemon carinicauda]|uniref:glutamate receptor ionotropic, delta-2-like n=1 Tax=Palaemon carinicauda TaxID=392227 RepID=UPI0035B65344
MQRLVLFMCITATSSVQNFDENSPSISCILNLKCISEDFQISTPSSEQFVDTNHQYPLEDNLFKVELQTGEKDEVITLPSLPMGREKDPLLSDALSFIAGHQLGRCALVIAYDAVFADSLALEALLGMSHQRQVVEIKTPKDFTRLVWKSSKCRGYIFLLGNPVPFLNFADDTEDSWDYLGKYVLVGLSVADLNLFVSSKKGKKTEQVIGLVQEDPDEWKVYRNQLFWGEGVLVANRWRKQGFTSNAEIFPEKIWNLKGAPIKLITFEFEPHIIREKNPDGTGGRYFGSDVQIAIALSEALNFTLIIERPPKGEYWGNKYPNGSWSGLTGKISRNEGHFGMAFIFLTNNFDELAVLDYSRFYSYDTSCFMARTEPPLPRWESLAAPFKQSTWLAASISFLAFCPIIALLAKASDYFGREEKQLQSFSYSNLYTWGLILRVSQIKLPKRSPTQIWFVFLSLYCIVLTTGYCSNLTTFLTVERPRPTMETIKELYSSKLDILAVGYFFKESLVQSGNAYLKGLVPRYIGLPSYESSFDLLERGKGVLMASNTYLEYLHAASLVQPGVPSVRIMKECFSPYNIAIILQKHFPLKRSFDKVLASLFDQGIMRQWFLDTFQLKKMMGIEADFSEEASRKKNEKGGPTLTGGIPLSVDHMQGIFYIHLMSLLLATIIFLFEVYCLKR